MGSWTSTLSYTPPTPGPPDLPLDIYVEVLGHYNPLSAYDRITLLALSQCCRALREISQRILFRGLRPELQGRRRIYDIDHLLQIHSHFLHSVVDSPSRVARYVTCYSQDQLGLDPQLLVVGKKESLSRLSQRYYCGRLTEQALPLMVNLKHLCFGPRVHPCATTFLRKCTFQLESFTWVGPGYEEALYSDFLPAQSGLLHLHIDSEGDGNRRRLPDGLCPSLISISCPLSEFSSIAKGRHIIALNITEGMAGNRRLGHAVPMDAAERKGYLSALRKIQYLQVQTLLEFQQTTIDTTLPEVTMLDVRGETREVFNNAECLKQFTALRSLRLWGISPTPDPPARQRIAAWAFSQCPDLEEVLLVNWSYYSLHVPVWRMTHPSGNKPNEKMLEMDLNAAIPWWKAQPYEQVIVEYF